MLAPTGSSDGDSPANNAMANNDAYAEVYTGGIVDPLDDDD